MGSSGWVLLLLLPVAVLYSTPVVAQGSSWKTLSGTEPRVVAKGGFSGLFPDSSYLAYAFANALNLPNVIFWCDVQLTKDDFGICLPDMFIDNCTDVKFTNSPLLNRARTYSVNGNPVSGLFAVDFTLGELHNNTLLVQENPSRTPNFDSGYTILTVTDVAGFNQSLWLNIQHDLFYKQHGLNMTKFVLEVSRTVPVPIAYISSPEVAFLTNIARVTRTKLIFRIPEDETIEPSTNQTYDSLLKNLTFIKTFASGILIPKSYIWPVTSDIFNRFLLPYTSIVIDAHNASLEVFASEFANDALFAFNYSYNPVSEYLGFIDNEKFSVDGLISDFPSTAWEAIGCFSHLNNSTLETKIPLVITHHGDSGDFPPCTDLAYTWAIKQGADVIDCSVQVTKDGKLVCLSSIDLVSSTTVSKSLYATRFSTIPKIQSKPGIFSFNFTWDEIQNNLKPLIVSPWVQIYQSITRSPANKNAGKFMTLDDFLNLVNGSTSTTGVMINLENAHFLVEDLNFDIIGSVISALDMAGYSNQTRSKVMIHSSSSATLIPFRKKTNYTIVYKLVNPVGDADNKSVTDIKSFAHAVSVEKQSMFLSSVAFLFNLTKIAKTLRSAGLDVYAYYLRNEFVSTPWDFYGDVIMEIYNLIEQADITGVITDFPASSVLYKKNECSKSNFSIPEFAPGTLVDPNIIVFMPPIPQPYPTLTEVNVSESALPPVIGTLAMPNSTKPAASPPEGSRNAQPRISPSVFAYFPTLVGLACFLI